MARPSDFLDTSGPISMVAQTTRANDWLTALKNAWAGTTAPPSPVAHQFWMDTAGTPTLKIYDGTVWRALFQTGVDDATSLAAMIVGAFGLGGVWTVDTDWNSVSQVGLTAFQNSLTTTPNAPSTSTAWMCLQIRRSSAVAVQFAMRASGNDISFRRQVSGVWEPWVVVYNQRNVVGAVSQSGGLVTGAILQSGSNANGSFTKFANGLLICESGVINATVAATTAAGNLFRSLVRTWTFPLAFGVGSPVVVGSAVHQSSAVAFPTYLFNQPSILTEADYYIVCGASAASGATAVKLTATGYWTTPI